jgi:hypothetical protein
MQSTHLKPVAYSANGAQASARRPVKPAILGTNGAKIYGVRPPVQHADAGWRDDRLAVLRTAYLDRGRQPSNLA